MPRYLALARHHTGAHVLRSQLGRPVGADTLALIPCCRVFILLYDEVRKFLMRKTGGMRREGILYEVRACLSDAVGVL